MLAVKVEGGTNAGTKRPLKQPAPAWTCDAAHQNPGYATRCLHCGQTRP